MFFIVLSFCFLSFADRLVDCLVDRLVDCLDDCLVDRLVDVSLIVSFFDSSSSVSLNVVIMLEHSDLPVHYGLLV